MEAPDPASSTGNSIIQQRDLQEDVKESQTLPSSVAPVPFRYNPNYPLSQNCTDGSENQKSYMKFHMGGSIENSKANTTIRPGTETSFFLLFWVVLASRASCQDAHRALGTMALHQNHANQWSGYLKNNVNAEGAHKVCCCAGRATAVPTASRTPSVPFQEQVN